MSYSTNLASWGDTGQAYPNGHSHEAGRGHVDAWENYFKHNVIADLRWLIDEVNANTNPSISDSGTPIAGDIAGINFTGPVTVALESNDIVQVNFTHDHDGRYLRKSKGDKRYLRKSKGGTIDANLSLADGNFLELEYGSALVLRGEDGTWDTSTQIVQGDQNAADLSIIGAEYNNQSTLYLKTFESVNMKNTGGLVLPDQPYQPNLATPGQIYFDSSSNKLKFIDNNYQIRKIRMD
jgi:hypothetical protein